jgi:pimeloyl-ACP methyl ester carboxylesterase
MTPTFARRSSRGWSRLIVVGALALLGVGALAPARAQTPARSAAWADADCSRFKIASAATDMTCGYVTVPLRHAQPTGPTIQLAVVVLPATDGQRQPDPLFMAQGGPGGSTIATYADYLHASPRSRPVTDRDIVLWDQRGTLFSKPALLCPEVAVAGLRAAMATSNPPDPNAPDPSDVCGARLVAEVGDVSAFNSAENADDVDDVRRALGYDRINFYGVSYGTELGQFVMRQHPEILNSVVLDAVVPLSYNLFIEPAFAKQRIATKYFDACAADPRCNAAFPELGARYLALIERLDAAPVTVSVSPPGAVPADFPTPAPAVTPGPEAGSIAGLFGGTPYRIRLTGELLEGALYQALYSDTHDLVPLIVDRADRGDYTYVSSFVLPLVLFDDTFATGMWVTVACADRGDTDPTAVDYSTIVPRLADAARADAASEVATCRQLQIRLLPRADLEPIRSDLPTLLLSGAYDPITPPEYAATLLPDLPNAQHVIFPYGAHGQAVTSPCANRIVAGFIDSPLAPVDAACAAAQQARFLTEQDLITFPPMRRALAASGLSGLFGVALSAAPGLGSALLLGTALPFYVVGWLVGLLRRPRPDTRRPDWTLGWSRGAPWFAIAAGVILNVFLIGLGLAFVTTLVTTQALLGLGAIPATWRGLFWLPPLLVAAVALMCVATVAVWKGRRRSLAGRLYYTILTLGGLVGVGTLFSLGVMNLWHA